jgi:PAS domain S-box-containing protein
MREEVLRLIDEQAPSILDRWISRLKNSGISLGRQPDEEIRRNCREVLASTVRAISGQDIIVPVNLPGVALGLQEREDSEQELLLALLLCQQSIIETLKAELTDGKLDQSLEVIDHAFSKVLASYSLSFCQSCRANQERSQGTVRQRLQSLVDIFPDGIVLFDDEHVIRGWNPGAELLFGYQRDEILGKKLDVIVPEQRLETGELTELDHKLQLHGQARLAETEICRKGGSHLWVDANFTIVRGSDGKNIGAWAVYRDISENKRLQESKMQAERLALIGTMSAKLAHEIHNPLSSIVLNLDLIRDEVAEGHRGEEDSHKEIQELAASIDSELQRIQAVVEDYLRFARLPRVRPQRVEFDELVRRHMDFLLPELAERHVRLELNLEAKGILVSLDEDQFWQAMLNLIRNSLEAMPDGGKLQIASRQNEESLECEISDTGVGMSATVQSKMFRPFFSTKRGGTGLGMSLTQQILHEHEAVLHCESNPGEGTRFVILIPLEPKRREAGETRQATSSK